MKTASNEVCFKQLTNTAVEIVTKISEVYLKLCQTAIAGFFVKIVNGWKTLITSAKKLHHRRFTGF